MDGIGDTPFCRAELPGTTEALPALRKEGSGTVFDPEKGCQGLFSLSQELGTLTESLLAHS